MKKLGRPTGYRGKTTEGDAKLVIAEAGKVAPDFTLHVLEKAKPKTFQLSSLKGKKPVALIFGAYT